MVALLGVALPQVGRAQSSCVVTPATVAAWPAPLDRMVQLAPGALGVRAAIERAAAEAGVHFTYQAELLPVERLVCGANGRVRLGDALGAWLEGTRLRPVVVGTDRVVLAPVRQVAAQVQAAPAEASATAHLAPVVVVGDAIAGSAGSATVSRTVVSAQSLEATGMPGFAQALSGTVPGLWMWTPNPTSLGGGMASLRGASSFSSNFPKVFVDGIEVANPLFLSQLSTDQVAQVEVIRGPQGASAYGGGAIAGVVHITTRMAAGMTEGRRLSMRTSAGIAESQWSPLGAFVQDHSFSAQGGSLSRSAGLALSTSTIGAFIPGAFSQQFQASAGAGLVGAKSRAQFTARFFGQRAGNAVSPLMPAGVSTTLGDTADAQGVKEYTLGGTWGLQGGRWAHTLVGGLDGYRLHNVSLMRGQLRTPADSALLAAQGEADRASLRWSSTTEVGPATGVSARVTLAADHSALRDATAGTSTTTGGAPVPGVMWRYTTGVNASTEVSLTRALVVNGGVRFERNAGYTVLSGFSALPSFGAAFRHAMGPATLTLRTAYGKAIAPPRVSTRATAWGGRMPSVLALEPEEQSGIEVGADLAIGSRFVARITRYDQRASDLIQPVAEVVNTGRGDRSSMAYRLQNMGAIANRGWEFEGNVGFGALSLTGALGLTDSRVQAVAPGYTGDLRAGDRVLQVPARTASLTASWLGRRWSASGTMARASDWMNYDWLTLGGDLADPMMTPPQGSALRAYWRNYPGVTRLRAAFSRDITNAFGLVVSGENLLNVQVGEPDNVTVVPGRTWRAGLKARF